MIEFERKLKEKEKFVIPFYVISQNVLYEDVLKKSYGKGIKGVKNFDFRSNVIFQKKESQLDQYDSKDLYFLYDRKLTSRSCKVIVGNPIHFLFHGFDQV